jgi:hypothetical protein
MFSCSYFFLLIAPPIMPYVAHVIIVGSVAFVISARLLQKNKIHIWRARHKREKRRRKQMYDA